MTRTVRGKLLQEADKHFRGTPASRLRTARRLGRRALKLYRATLPPGTTLEDTHKRMQSRKCRGRRPSAVAEALGE